MSLLRTAGIAIAAFAVLYVLGLLVGGGGEPSSGQIKAALVENLQRHAKDCVISKFSFIRGGTYAPDSHRDLPQGTVFHIIRATATYTVAQNDGSRSDPRDTTRTLYFYKQAGKWQYEVNSF